MPSWERNREALVFRAGEGEWYNQPHDKKWDMGEDALPLPSPPCHVELEQACKEIEDRNQLVVVDLSEMDWLVGQDWGFLIRLGKALLPKGIKPAIIVRERVARAAGLIGVNDYIDVVRSMEEAF